MDFGKQSRGFQAVKFLAIAAFDAFDLWSLGWCLDAGTAGRSGQKVEQVMRKNVGNSHALTSIDGVNPGTVASLVQGLSRNAGAARRMTELKTVIRCPVRPGA